MEVDRRMLVVARAQRFSLPEDLSVAHRVAESEKSSLRRRTIEGVIEGEMEVGFLEEGLYSSRNTTPHRLTREDSKTRFET